MKAKWNEWKNSIKQMRVDKRWFDITCKIISFPFVLLSYFEFLPDIFKSYSERNFTGFNYWWNCRWNFVCQNASNVSGCL